MPARHQHQPGKLGTVTCFDTLFSVASLPRDSATLLESASSAQSRRPRHSFPATADAFPFRVLPRIPWLACFFLLSTGYQLLATPPRPLRVLHLDPSPTQPVPANARRLSHPLGPRLQFWIYSPHILSVYSVISVVRRSPSSCSSHNTSRPLLASRRCDPLAHMPRHLPSAFRYSHDTPLRGLRVLCGDTDLLALHAGSMSRHSLGDGRSAAERVVLSLFHFSLLVLHFSLSPCLWRLNQNREERTESHTSCRRTAEQPGRSRSHAPV